MNTDIIEEKMQEFAQLEEMCDGDSDQIVAMYRRNLRHILTELYVSHGTITHPLLDSDDCEVCKEDKKQFEQGVLSERERIITMIAPFMSNMPLKETDLQKLNPEQIRKFLTPLT